MKSNITKQIINAIKQCSYTGFRLNGRETKIEIVKRASSFNQEKHPFAQDAVVLEEIETKISDYSKDHSGASLGNQDRKFRGWANEDNSDFFPSCVGLLGNILKENDCLIAHWIVANESEWTRKNGIYRDELRLEIWRSKKDGSFKLVGGFTFNEDIGNHEIASCRMIKG